MSDTDGMEDTQRQGGPTLGPDGSFIRTMDQAERDAEAARLRSRSMSYREIAKTLDVDVHTAHDMVKRAMAAVVREAGEAVIALELEKLDRAEAAVLTVLEAKHYTVSNGQLIYIGGKRVKDEVSGRWFTEGGEPLYDDAPVLAAVDRLVKISESRRKLLGVDAAQKMETTGVVRYELVGVDIDKLR